jgi:acyl dehydratase
MTVVAPTRTVAEVAVGDTLPELSVPITRTLIVATAIASRDYQDVHHDPDLAVERGSKDVFMNILTSNGLVDRYVTAWAGPAAVVKKIKIRLGAPNYPGDTMLLTGSVTAVDGDRVEVAVRGDNSLGAHVSGTVVVRLPGPADRATSPQAAKGQA